MSMQCEKCGDPTGVIDSRNTNNRYERGMIRRRRNCTNCGHRFTTFEIPSHVLKQMLAAQASLHLLKDAINGGSSFTKTPKLKTITQSIEHFNGYSKT